MQTARMCGLEIQHQRAMLKFIGMTSLGTVFILDICLVQDAVAVYFIHFMSIPFFCFKLNLFCALDCITFEDITVIEFNETVLSNQSYKYGTTVQSLCLCYKDSCDQ
jgi:hypothetical protein